MARKSKKKTKKWTAKQLNSLYECWKEADNTKDRLSLIAERLPEMPQPTALSLMRGMARSDTKWVKWSTRKKNEKERAKLEKQKERERKRAGVVQRRKEREERRKRNEEKQADRSLREKLQSKLRSQHLSKLIDRISPEFFFCPDVRQYINNISCIFRVFSSCTEYDFSQGGSCEKCKRMDKHIPIVEEITNGGQKKRSIRNSSSDGRKSKKKSKKKAKTRTRASSRNKKC